jgi:hypothetical protein
MMVVSYCHTHLFGQKLIHRTQLKLTGKFQELVLELMSQKLGQKNYSSSSGSIQVWKMLSFG